MIGYEAHWAPSVGLPRARTETANIEGTRPTLGTRGSSCPSSWRDLGVLAAMRCKLMRNKVYGTHLVVSEAEHARAIETGSRVMIVAVNTTPAACGR